MDQQHTLHFHRRFQISFLMKDFKSSFSYLLLENSKDPTFPEGKYVLINNGFRTKFACIHV